MIHVGKEAATEAEALLNLWKHIYSKSKVDYQHLFGEKAIESINQYSAENDIDLLVLSTRERGFIEDLFHRSFTKRMAINTKWPLFIAPAQMVLFSI